MEVSTAIALLKQVYLEERQGIADSEAAKKRKDAIDRYPVVMAIALELFAREFAKGLP